MPHFPGWSPLTLAAGVALVGFTFGGMLTLLPSITGDYFGIRNFGVNFGMMLTGSGLGGLAGTALVGGLVRDLTGTYILSYVAAVIFCAMGAAIVFTIRPPRITETGEPVSS
jgi:MFS transporter, OFA family, oxalate/formate antiporter